MFQTLSGGMSPAGHYGWTTAPQPPTQSNHKDPASVTTAAARFPQLV